MYFVEFSFTLHGFNWLWIFVSRHINTAIAIAVCGWYLQKELPCCWECKTCRNNEIIVDGTRCQQCNLTMWPDDVTATECLPIAATYLRWTDTLSVALLVLTLLGTVYTSFQKRTLVLNDSAIVVMIRFSKKPRGLFFMLKLNEVCLWKWSHIIKCVCMF